MDLSRDRLILELEAVATLYFGMATEHLRFDLLLYFFVVRISWLFDTMNDAGSHSLVSHGKSPRNPAVLHVK
jgi:hypothetical protein